MRLPVNPPYNFGFKWRVPTTTAVYGLHSGIDYAVATGTNVYAPVAGIVTGYTTGPFHGLTVEIYDPKGKRWHRMMHNSKLLVKPGSRVDEGEVVARSGATGRGVTGPHVHYDVRSKDKHTSINDFINPESLITKPPIGGKTMTQAEATRFVKSLYKQIFNRTADAGGLANYVGHIVSGRYTPEKVVSELLTSPEGVANFKRKYQTSSGGSKATAKQLAAEKAINALKAAL